MGALGPSLVIETNGSVGAGEVLRCAVRVDADCAGRSIQVQLLSSVIARDVVVHRDPWSSSLKVREGGFAAGDVVMFDLEVPENAPATERFASGAIEWQVEASCEEESADPISIQVLADRRASRIIENPYVSPGLSGIVLVSAMLIGWLLLMVLISLSAGSLWPIGVAVASTVPVVGITLWDRRAEPFAFHMFESPVYRGQAVEIELDSPSTVAAVARLVTVTRRTRYNGEGDVIKDAFTVGPVSKIEPGVVRTVVAVPADTEPPKLVKAGKRKDIRTFHQIWVQRDGDRKLSLLGKTLSTRKIEILE